MKVSSIPFIDPSSQRTNNDSILGIGNPYFSGFSGCGGGA